MSVTRSPAGSTSGQNPLPVTVIVLAGGLGRRMADGNKLLKTVGQVPIIRRVVTEALASECNRVLVVLGHEAGRVREALSDLNVGFVVNPHYQEGMGASVRTGARQLACGHAVIVALGDMPFVDRDVFNRLIACWRAAPNVSACQPVYGNKRGNPVLWAPRHVPELRQLAGDTGARAMLSQYRQAISSVPVGTAGIFADIDTSSDLVRAQNTV